MEITVANLMAIAAYAGPRTSLPGDINLEPAASAEPGDVVWIFSRGNWRRGIVEKVARTGTRTVAYVTPGGIEDARKIHARYAPGQPIYAPRMTPEERLAHQAEQYARPYTDWINITRKTAAPADLQVEVGR